MSDRFEPGCACLGCHDDREVIIDHPEHGERAVCTDHANGYPVLTEVTQ